MIEFGVTETPLQILREFLFDLFHIALKYFALFARSPGVFLNPKER